MSSIARRLRRKKQAQENKAAAKQLDDIATTLSGLPDECTKCSGEFVLERDADTWAVDYSNGVISLFCTLCAENTATQA